VARGVVVGRDRELERRRAVIREQDRLVDPAASAFEGTIDVYPRGA
jgi:hypothetical protein